MLSLEEGTLLIKNSFIWLPVRLKTQSSFKSHEKYTWLRAKSLPIRKRGSSQVLLCNIMELKIRMHDINTEIKDNQRAFFFLSEETE